jgi:hypothetical protein
MFYLTAPLSILGQNLLKSNIPDFPLPLESTFHSGVGFQSIDNDKQYEFYFDFIAVNFGTDVIFPKIITLPNGTESLQWKNESIVTLGLKIDRSYWTASEYIATITSDEMSRYQQWILETYVPMNTIYAYSETSKGITRDALFNPLLRSSICDNFCFSSFIFFQDQQCVPIDFPVPPKETIISFIVNEIQDIVQLDYDNAAERAFIIEFYKELEKQFEQRFGFVEVLNQTMQQILSLSNVQERDLAMKSLRSDTLLAPYMLANLLKASAFTFMIVYTYSPMTNDIKYFRVNFSNTYVDYIISDLKRNIIAYDYNGLKVLDLYTDPIMQICQREPTKPAKDVTTGANFIVFFLILMVVIIILAILIYVYRT